MVAKTGSWNLPIPLCMVVLVCLGLYHGATNHLLLLALSFEPSFGWYIVTSTAVCFSFFAWLCFPWREWEMSFRLSFSLCRAAKLVWQCWHVSDRIFEMWLLRKKMDQGRRRLLIDSHLISSALSQVFLAASIWCLKIPRKVLFNIASEASYVYILSGQKFIKKAKNGSFGRVFENLKLAVKQCYQTGQF